MYYNVLVKPFTTVRSICVIEHALTATECDCSECDVHLCHTGKDDGTDGYLLYNNDMFILEVSFIVCPLE